MAKKIPLRMCIACRNMQEKNNLIRIVKNNLNEIFIDCSFKANGRGAYVCKNLNCLEKCIKTKALNRTFKCNVDENVINELKKTIINNN